MRKLQVVALAAILALSLSPVAAAAATTVLGPAFSDIAGHPGEFELTALRAYGVFTGDAGTTAVRPNDTITRAETAKVLVTMLGRDGLARGMGGMRPPFADEAAPWSWGYINCAQVMGLIQGYDDDTFQPGRAVTYAELITMLVRAVPGHKEQVPPGFWPYNYLFHAIDSGFTGTVDLSFAGLPATRGDVARLVFATMQVPRLSLATGTFGQVIPGSAVLDGAGPGQLGFLYRGVLTDYNLEANELTLGATDRALAPGVYLVGAVGFEEAMNFALIAAAGRDGRILAAGRTEAAGSYRGVFKRLDDSVATAHKLEFTDGTKIPIPHTAGGVPVLIPARINGKLLDIGDLEAGTECVVTKDAGGKAAYVTGLHLDLVDYVGTFHKSTSDPVADTRLALGYDEPTVYSVPASARVTINGLVSGRDDLRKWDVVYIARNYNHAPGENVAFEVRAVRRVVEGKPTSVHTSYPGPEYYATIGGRTYLTGYHEGAVEYGIGLLSPLATYKIGLDRDDMAFVRIGLETATPFALIKGYTIYGGGAATVEVDVRGVSLTYTVPDTTKDVSGTLYSLREMIQAQVSGFAWLKVNERGEVIDFVAVTSFGAGWLVVANSASGITVRTGVDPDVYQFLPHSAGIVCYRQSSAYTYVDGAAVGVGAGHTLAKAALSCVTVDFDGVADDISVTLYRYTYTAP